MNEANLYQRPDQTQPATFGETFDVPDTIGQAVPEMPEAAVRGADSPEIINATNDAVEAADQAQHDRYVFAHEKGDFEVKHASSEAEANANVVRDDVRFIDDGYHEEILRRKEVARREAEYAAESKELQQAIAFNTQAISATRDFAQRYGINA